MPSEKPKPERDNPNEEREKKRRGPRTREGKAVSRLNALRHGLAAETPVVMPVERMEDWEWLRAGVLSYLGAEGVLEEALAERIATTIWRLFRAVRYETESMRSYIEDVPHDWRAGQQAARMPVPKKLTPEVVRQMDRMLIGRLLPDEASLEKVMRYETKHHRILLQTLHQFLVLKGLRKQGPTYSGIPTLGPPGTYAPGASRSKGSIDRYPAEGRDDGDETGRGDGEQD